MKSRVRALAGAMLLGKPTAGRLQIRWTQERLDFLREHYPAMSMTELTAAFNARFGLSITRGALGYQLHRHRILKCDNRS